MSVADQVTRIQTNIANAYSSCEAKGATLPKIQNSDNLASVIDSITVGSGSGGATVTAVNKTGKSINKGDKVWVNENNGTYNLVDFSKKNYSNFSIYGSPIIDKQTGIVNGFSPNDYLKIIGTFDPQTSDFEIVIASMPTSNSSSYVLAGTANSTVAINPTLISFLSTGGNKYNISLSITSTIPLNTKVYTKIERVGDVFTLYSSFDGIDWVFESSATDSLSLNPVNLNIGFYGYEQYNSFIGEVYLEDCYINVDGQRWWSPVLDISNVDENTIMGYAGNDALPDEEITVGIASVPGSTPSVTGGSDTFEAQLILDNVVNSGILKTEEEAVNETVAVLKDILGE